MHITTQCYAVDLSVTLNKRKFSACTTKLTSCTYSGLYIKYKQQKVLNCTII